MEKKQERITHPIHLMHRLHRIHKPRPPHPPRLIHPQTPHPNERPVPKREIRLHVLKRIMRDLPTTFPHNLPPRLPILLLPCPLRQRPTRLTHHRWPIPHRRLLPTLPLDLEHFFIRVRWRGDALGDAKPLDQALEVAVPADGGGVLGVEAVVGAFGLEDGPFGQVAGEAGGGVVCVALPGVPVAGEGEGCGLLGADCGVDGEGVEGVHLGVVLWETG